MMPSTNCRGGMIGSDTSPACMFLTRAPTAWAISIPRPSSASVPTFQVPDKRDGRVAPEHLVVPNESPGMSTTPRRALTTTRSP